MIFEKCTADPRSGSTLTSPEFTLSSDQELTFTMTLVPTSSNITVNVYKTSIFGHIDTLLGSYSPEFNTSAEAGDTIDYTICLPVGTYQLVFVASDAENDAESKAAITKVLLTESPCTYTSLAGGCLVSIEHLQVFRVLNTR